MAKRKRLDETEASEVMVVTKLPFWLGLQNALIDAVDSKKVDLATIDRTHSVLDTKASNTSSVDLFTSVAFLRHARTFLSWRDIKNGDKVRIHVCYSEGFCERDDRDTYSFSLVLIDSQSQCVKNQIGYPYQINVKVSLAYYVWFDTDLVNKLDYYTHRASEAWNRFRRTLQVPSSIYNIDILRAIISLVDSKLDPKASNDINQRAPGDPLVAFQHWSLGDIGHSAFPREIHSLIGEFIGYHHDEDDADWRP